MLVVCTVLPRECINMKLDVSYLEVACNEFLYKMEDVLRSSLACVAGV